MNPLVSIVVPVYNGERYIDDCMKRLLEQTYAPLEILLVDDGSGDGSGGICDRYAAAVSMSESFTGKRRPQPGREIPELHMHRESI